MAELARRFTPGPGGAGSLPGLDDLEGVVRATAPTTLMMLPASYVLAMIEHIRRTETLTQAAIALAWSEAGTEAMLIDQQGWRDTYEDWPEMSALVAAIDALRAGWRAEGKPGA